MNEGMVEIIDENDVCFLREVERNERSGVRTWVRSSLVKLVKPKPTIVPIAIPTMPCSMMNDENGVSKVISSLDIYKILIY